MKKIFSVCLLLLIASISAQQYISVSAKTPDELVRDVLIGSQNASCISVSNVSATGWQDYGSNPTSYGYFEKGTLPFDMEKGIILSTGNITNAPGPNNVLLDDEDDLWPGDPDLALALQESVYNYLNASWIEFDFVANNTSGISFEYLFLSEEYRPVNCTYSDGFAFLIKKAGTSDPYTNIALVPGTQDPVTSLSINPASNCPKNVGYFGSFNGNNSPTAFDGQTKVLTAKTDIIPGVKYRIKLVIADHLAGNDRTGRYDSAVFLKAGSFVGKKDLGPDLLFADSTALCEGNGITVDATTTGATSYQWFKNGNLLAGETNPTITISGDQNNNGTYSVEISLSGCLLKGSRTIEFAEKPVTIPKNYCNYKDGKPIAVSLQDLNSEFITNYQPYFQVQYYADAALTVLLKNQWSYTSDTTVYYKIQSGACNEVTGSVQFLTPKRSNALTDKTICPGSTTSLDAGAGFQYYKWMRKDGSVIAEGESANRIIDVPVGNYVVELTSQNGCKLKQTVSVIGADLPSITHIDVSGSTATVNVSGGILPYEYSMDGINFQSSNIFRDITRGLHRVYVRDAQKCVTLEKEFLIINLITVLTPNGDGKNDVMDYSDLKIKENVKLKIFDRNGITVYESTSQTFIWDGKLMGRPLPTGTYWYHISWIEPFTNLPVNYHGWVLLKNRN